MDLKQLKNQILFHLLANEISEQDLLALTSIAKLSKDQEVDISVNFPKNEEPTFRAKEMATAITTSWSPPLQDANNKLALNIDKFLVEVKAQLIDTGNRSNKILLIKLLREFTGLSLIDAKHAIEINFGL